MKNSMRCSLAILTILTIFTSGCASIVDGGDKSVRINSKPVGAKVTIVDKNGKLVATQTTPATVTLSRVHGPFNPENYKLTFELPGYHPAEVYVKSTINGWYFGNVIIGGLFGLIIDPMTGAAWTLSPRAIERTLISTDGTMSAQEIEALQTIASPTVKRATAGKFGDSKY